MSPHYSLNARFSVQLRQRNAHIKQLVHTNNNHKKKVARCFWSTAVSFVVAN